MKVRDPFLIKLEPNLANRINILTDGSQRRKNLQTGAELGQGLINADQQGKGTCVRGARVHLRTGASARQNQTGACLHAPD